MIKTLFATLMMLSYAGKVAAFPYTLKILIDEDYPPYTYSEDGIAKGIYVDLIKEAAKGAPLYKVEFKPMPRKRALALVASGEQHLVMPVQSNDPYLPQLNLAVRLGREHTDIFTILSHSPMTPALWPHDFVGMQIGIADGHYQSKETERFFLRITETPDILTGLQMLYLGRIGALIGERRCVLWTLEQQHNVSQLMKLNIVSVATLEQTPSFLAILATNTSAWPYLYGFTRTINAELGRMEKLPLATTHYKKVTPSLCYR